MSHGWMEIKMINLQRAELIDVLGDLLPVLDPGIDKQDSLRCNLAALDVLRHNVPEDIIPDVYMYIYRYVCLGMYVYF